MEEMKAGSTGPPVQLTPLSPTQNVIMLRLSDFVICRKRYYNQSREVYMSALEHCRKMKFRTYLHLTLISKFLLLSWLSDSVVCSIKVFIFKIVGSISNNVKLKFISSSYHVNTIFKHSPHD